MKKKTVLRVVLAGLALALFAVSLYFLFLSNDLGRQLSEVLNENSSLKVQVSSLSSRMEELESGYASLSSSLEGSRVIEGFVDISKLDLRILIELKYRTADNFTKQVLYDYSTCILREKTALKLLAVSMAVKKDGYRLKIWDGYRSYAASYKLWDAYPDPNFVANPDMGDRHCTGGAVDLTLVNAQGKELPMPTGFDDFSPAASGNQSTGEAYANWQYLRNVMTTNGFKSIPTEWWHYKDSDPYPLIDLDVKKLFE